MASDDSDFERKAADIIGLYLKPARYVQELVQAQGMFCTVVLTCLNMVHERCILSLKPRLASSESIEGLSSMDESSIRTRAYELWTERGYPVGSDQEDWSKAEQELSRRAAKQ